MKLSSTSHLFTLLAVASQLVVAEPRTPSTGLSDLDAILKDMDIFIDSTVSKSKDLVIEIEDNSQSFFKDFSSTSKKFFQDAKKKQSELMKSLFSSFSNGFGSQIIEIDLEDGDLPSFQQLKANPNRPLVSEESPEYVEFVYTIISDEPATPIDMKLDDKLMWIEPIDLNNVKYNIQDSGQIFKLDNSEYSYDYDQSPSYQYRPFDDCGGFKKFHHSGRFSFVALSGLLVLLSMSLFLFPLMVILSYRRRQQDHGLEYGRVATDAPPEYPTDEKTRTASAPEIISPIVVVEELDEEADEHQPLNPSQNH